MAQGDLTVFEEFAEMVGEEVFDFESDTLKLGIVDNTSPPGESDATPAWADYSANEVSTAGGYPAGGVTLTSVTFTEAGGVATLDAANIQIAQNGSGFTDGYWGILYDDSSSDDRAIAYLELGGPVSEQAGPININWNSAGILTITVS